MSLQNFGGSIQANTKYNKLGHDATEDSWLAWSEVRNIPALHTYLRTHNLAKLVPKEHR